MKAHLQYGGATVPTGFTIRWGAWRVTLDFDPALRRVRQRHHARHRWSDLEIREFERWPLYAHHVESW